MSLSHLRPLLLILVLTVAMPHPAPAQDDAQALRAMSFNIRLAIDSDGEHAWRHRADRAASVIRFHQPDVVGLQEALVEQLRDLEISLPEYQWVGVGRDDGEQGGEFSAIMFRPDRLELKETDTFWLSETPDVPGSKSWDAAITRVVTWALFERRSDGQQFYHFNTHFDHIGEAARRQSAQLIVDSVTVRAGELPIVVTGDFNAQPDSEPYATVTASLVDARVASETPPHGPEHTFSTFTATTEPTHRIDYVFVTPGIRVLRFATLAEHWEGRHASDHFPVVADVVLP